MMPNEPWTPWSRWSLIAILGLAALVRVAVMSRGLGRLDDPDNYLPLARSLAEGHGFALNGRPTAYRPPLYPILLAPLVARLGDRLAQGVASLHLALGLGTVALTAFTARRWELAPRRALAAAAIVACDPVLVSQARVVMTETLAAFLIAATLAALASNGSTYKGAASGGLGFGLAALCRPNLLPAAALVAIAAVVAGPGRWRDRALRGLALIGVTVATLAPWAWRNDRVFGELVWTTTHGGYTLAYANNPAYYADVLDGPPGAVWSGPNQKRWWDSVHRETAGLSEPQADRHLRAIGLRMLSERPRDFLRASLARLGRFWGIAPADAVYPRWLRVASAAWTVPLWVALALGLTRREIRRWPEVAAPLIVVALSAVHSIFWTDLRMRAPIVPAIALIAAGARTGSLRDSSDKNDHVKGLKKKK